MRKSSFLTSLVALHFNTFIYCYSANSAKERCKTCGDEILPGDLIQHMRNHMGPRRCEICNYEAPTKHHLREHMNTHTGLKVLNWIIEIFVGEKISYQITFFLEFSAIQM